MDYRKLSKVLDSSYSAPFNSEFAFSDEGDKEVIEKIKRYFPNAVVDVVLVNNPDWGTPFRIYKILYNQEGLSSNEENKKLASLEKETGLILNGWEWENHEIVGVYLQEENQPLSFNLVPSSVTNSDSSFKSEVIKSLGKKFVVEDEEFPEDHNGLTLVCFWYSMKDDEAATEEFQFKVRPEVESLCKKKGWRVEFPDEFGELYFHVGK